MRTIAIIPARGESKRLPNKPMQIVNGKSILARVYEACKRSGVFEHIIIAASTDEIYLHAMAMIKGSKTIDQAYLMKENYRTGTDRVAAAYAQFKANGYEEVDLVVNPQCDRPYLGGNILEYFTKWCQTLITLHNRANDVFTIVHQQEVIDTKESQVYVVMDRENQALYFSRLPIPYHTKNSKAHSFVHIGVYGYRPWVLKHFHKIGQHKLGNFRTKLEGTEDLEQLRWLEYGGTISCYTTIYDIKSVDTKQDLKRINK